MASEKLVISLYSNGGKGKKISFGFTFEGEKIRKKQILPKLFNFFMLSIP